MKKIFLFFFLLLPLAGKGAEIAAELTYLGTNNSIKLGSFIRTKILLGPHGDKYLKELENSVGENLLKGFYLHEVNNAQVLLGGEDYLEADLTLILISPLDPAAKNMWHSIPFRLINFTSGKADLKPKNFIILGQSVGKDWWYLKLGFLLSVLVFLVMVYFGWKRIKNKKILKELEQEKQEQIKSWQNLILNAKERSQFEHLYLQREAWQALMPTFYDKASPFFIAVESHQYKPAWTEEELREVINSMEDLKRMVHGI